MVETWIVSHIQMHKDLMHFKAPKKVESSTAVVAGVLLRFDGSCLDNVVDNFDNFFMCEESLFIIYDRNVFTSRVRLDVRHDVNLILMLHKFAHFIESALLAEVTPKLEHGFVDLLSVRDIDDIFTLVV